MGDFIDHDLDWGQDEEDAPEAKCKRCGKTGLTWYNIGTSGYPQWRLFNEEGLRLTPHVCPPQDHSNAFEDES